MGRGALPAAGEDSSGTSPWRDASKTTTITTTTIDPSSLLTRGTSSSLAKKPVGPFKLPPLESKKRMPRFKAGFEGLLSSP